MDHLLKCECGREHVVSQSQAGQEINCDCGKLLRVPTLRGLRELPLASTSSAAIPTETRTIWQGWRGISLAGATAVFLISAGFCGWFLVKRYNIDTSYTAESEIAAGEEMLDMYDPEELSLVWDSFQKRGLRVKDRPDFYWWNLYAKEQELLAKVSGTVAGVFGLVALGVWFSTKRKSRTRAAQR